MDITTRPAHADELELLREIHRLSMQEKVIATWGRWDEAEQRGFWKRRVERGHLHAVEVDGRLAGIWEIDWEEHRVHLANIQLHPDWHGVGIGTHLIEQLKLKAAPRPLELRVLRVNPAKRLYERLGFVDYDETETHHYMRYTPSPAESGEGAGG